MKTLLVLAAALALPLCALAQPATEGSKPPPSGVAGAAPGKSTAVSGVTVAGHCPVPPDSHWASTMFDAPANARNRRSGPSPGTLEFLEKEVLLARDGAHNYAQMSGGLESVIREQSRAIALLVNCHGALKSIKFLHVSEAGFDDYEVEFADGALEWEVAPLDAHQKTPQIAIRYFYPQPATRTFEDLLHSMERGRPNYADLAPDLAPIVQAQWPALQKTFKDWGSLGQVLFVRQADDGSYIYVVGFSRRGVVWQVAPLDADGKLTGLKYAEGRG